MPRSLSVLGAKLERLGFTGLRVLYGEVYYCVDPGSMLGRVTCYYVLCSHFHREHCSEDVTQIISVDRLVSPLVGITVKPGDTVKLRELVVKATSAYSKWSSSHTRGVGVGFYITFPSGLRLYYTGDTVLQEEILNFSRRVDVLVIPISGEGVFTPEEAVEAVKSIKPTLTIPVHYEDAVVYYKFRDMAQPYTQVVRL
jgi:L-ascorbate metabolism protein UlaG (beta-lactamase superfamily)